MYVVGKVYITVYHPFSLLASIRKMAASPVLNIILMLVFRSALSPIHSLDVSGSSHKRRASEALEDAPSHDYPHKLERDDDDATEDATQSIRSRLSSPALSTISRISSDTSGSAPGTPKEEDEHGETSHDLSMGWMWYRSR